MEQIDLLYCPCCGGESFIRDSRAIEPLHGYRSFPFRVQCSKAACGLATQFVATAALAALIWNRRVTRKPPRRARSPLLTPNSGRGILPASKRRSSAGGKAPGKRATAPKGAQQQSQSKPRSLK